MFRGAVEFCVSEAPTTYFSMLYKYILLSRFVIAWSGFLFRARKSIFILYSIWRVVATILLSAPPIFCIVLQMHLLRPILAHPMCLLRFHGKTYMCISSRISDSSKFTQAASLRYNLRLLSCLRSHTISTSQRGDLNTATETWATKIRSKRVLVCYLCTSTRPETFHCSIGSPTCKRNSKMCLMQR